MPYTLAFSERGRLASTVSIPAANEGGAADDGVQDLDPLGWVARRVDELGWVERIDALVPQDPGQRNLSMGLLVKAMIRNGLGFIPRVLYRMPRFFQDKTLERRLGPGVLAEHRNDDALGLALDAL